MKDGCAQDAKLIGIGGPPSLKHGICICPCAGEVTLTGRVLPIGGVKEKTLAARRSGVNTLLFPKGNQKDWDELTGDGVVTLVAYVCNA